MMSQLPWLRPETRERGWAPPSCPVSSVPFCSTLITQGFFFKILFKFFSIFIQNSSDMFIATLFTKTTRRSNPRLQQQVHEQTKCSLKDPGVGTSLAVQWLRLCLPMPGVQVQSLVGELRRHMPCTQKTKAGNRSNIVTHLIKFVKFNKDCKNSPHEKNLKKKKGNGVLALKRKDIVPHTTTWLSLFSKRPLTKRQIPHDSPYMRCLEESGS